MFIQDNITFLWLLGLLLYCVIALVFYRNLRRKLLMDESYALLEMHGGTTPEKMTPEMEENLRLLRGVRDKNLELQFTLRAVIGFLVLVSAFFYREASVSVYGVDLQQIDYEKKELRFKRGDDFFIFKIKPDITFTAKVYGIQPRPFRKDLGQLSLITHIFIARPVTSYAAKVFGQDICAQKYSDQNSLIQVIAVGRRIKSQIDRLSQVENVRCALITAVPLELQEQYHQQQLRPLREIDPGGDYEYDLSKFLAVTGFEERACP